MVVMPTVIPYWVVSIEVFKPVTLCKSAHNNRAENKKASEDDGVSTESTAIETSATASLNAIHEEQVVPSGKGAPRDDEQPSTQTSSTAVPLVIATQKHAWKAVPGGRWCGEFSPS